MMEIDGSMGEGGGQLLRTALTLAMCTGAPIRLRHIRARRARPGPRAQHLAAVRAAAAICSARVSGATPASGELEFAPGTVRPGEYDIDVGTAGSTLLVLQTILLPLSFCGAPSTVVLRERLAVPEEACSVETVAAAGAGNALHVRLDCAHLTTLFAGFGRRGVPAETVADRTAAEVRRHLDAGVALDQHLADQLFLPATYEACEIGPGRWAVALRSSGAGAQPVARRPPRTK